MGVWLFNGSFNSMFKDRKSNFGFSLSLTSKILYLYANIKNILEILVHKLVAKVNNVSHNYHFNLSNDNNTTGSEIVHVYLYADYMSNLINLTV